MKHVGVARAHPRAVAALALLLVACSDPGVPCAPCTADTICGAGSSCRAGYCVTPSEDPLRCPHAAPSGGASSSGGSSGSSGSNPNCMMPDDAFSYFDVTPPEMAYLDGGSLVATEQGSSASPALGVIVLDGGVSGTFWIRDHVTLSAQPADNLAFLELRQADGGRILELYASPSSIGIYSQVIPLRGSIDGGLAPGVEHAIELHWIPATSLDIGVDQRTWSAPLPAAAPGPATSLAAGIDHYDGSAIAPITAVHREVSLSTLGPLGSEPCP